LDAATAVDCEASEAEEFTAEEQRAQRRATARGDEVEIVASLGAASSAPTEETPDAWPNPRYAKKEGGPETYPYARLDISLRLCSVTNLRGGTWRGRGTHRFGWDLGGRLVRSVWRRRLCPGILLGTRGGSRRDLE